MPREYTIRPSQPAAPRIDYASELNPQQYQAVTAPPGPSLILAGAGSGKTRTLTYRVAYLLENGVHPSQILLLTFTNKAAREMLERVSALVTCDLSELWGGTFHSVTKSCAGTQGKLGSTTDSPFSTGKMPMNCCSRPFWRCKAARFLNCR